MKTKVKALELMEQPVRPTIKSADINPEYWTHLEHQYAGMAMQGMLSNAVGFDKVREQAKDQDCDIIPLIAEAARDYARALVKKYEEKEERK